MLLDFQPDALLSFTSVCGRDVVERKDHTALQEGFSATGFSPFSWSGALEELDLLVVNSGGPFAIQSLLRHGLFQGPALRCQQIVHGLMQPTNFSLRLDVGPFGRWEDVVQVDGFLMQLSDALGG